MSCSNGYSLFNGLCYQTIRNCFEYSRTIGSCVTCVQGYSLSNNACAIQPAPRNCINFSNGVCYQCASGFRVSSNGLYCMYLNCQVQTQADTICQQCASGFTWFNNQECRYLTDFCLSYSLGVCISCESFAANLQFNRCIPAFCTSYDYIAGKCRGCSSGYTLAYDRCLANIANCMNYTVNGGCATCATGFSLSNGACMGYQAPNCLSMSSSSTCSRCLYRFYRNDQLSTSNTCQSYSPFCVNIDPMGNCMSCCFGSTLVNGACQRNLQD